MVIVLDVAVVIKSPKRIDLTGDVLVELEGKHVLHLRFYIFVRSEVEAAALPSQTLYNRDLRVELNLRTEVLLEILAHHVVGTMDVHIVVVNQTHLVRERQERQREGVAILELRLPVHTKRDIHIQRCQEL